jgi:hypothetical protein
MRDSSCERDVCRPSAQRQHVAAWRFDPAAARQAAQLRGETVDQVLDLDVAERLEELRVAMTSVQILCAFLWSSALTQKFKN